MNQIKTNYPALYTLSSVFFFWGFIAAGNNIFIPFCRDYFHLDQFQSQLVDFAFYTAYYVGALLLFIWSNGKKRDVILYWGYKKSIIIGLVLSAFGALAMIIALNFNVFYGILAGLFVVGLGFSIQQTSANPFAISLGDEATGASRVNLGGGINSLGTTIGPIIAALVLFGTTKEISEEQIKLLSLDKVMILYLFVGLLFIGAAALFYFSKKLPNVRNIEPIEPANKAVKLLLFMTVAIAICLVPVFLSYKSPAFLEIVEWQKQYKISPNISLKSQIESALKPIEWARMRWLLGTLVIIVSILIFGYYKSAKDNNGWGAMKYPQLILGMLAIFVYVGVEVAVGSNLGELLKSEAFGKMSSSKIAPFISMYWGSMMIGRWAGAVYAFNLSKNKQISLLIGLPLLALGIITLAIYLAGYDISALKYYFVCVILQIILIIATRNHPIKTLIVNSILGISAIIIALNTTGLVAIYALLTAGLACSILWPAIFNLALMGLGKYTAQGSAFLVMMILGGGIIPPIQGKLADIIGIHQSYIVGVLCFAYLILFGFLVKRILEKQKISFGG